MKFQLPESENQLAAYDSEIGADYLAQQHLNASPPVRSMSSEKLANKTYSELIIEAIETHPQKRLTLSQIYEWMIKNVPTCRENANKPSSTGWKNCIRHNLSLHKEFQRLPIDTKNSYWYIDYEELERKRSSKHAAAGRKRARSFTNTVQSVQGFDLMSARDRIRTKSLGASQQPKLGFKRQISLNEAAVGPSSHGTGEISKDEHPLNSISEYSAVTNIPNVQSRCKIPVSIPEFLIPSAQIPVGVVDLELEKGERLLSELTAMEAGRNL